MTSVWSRRCQVALGRLLGAVVWLSCVVPHPSRQVQPEETLDRAGALPGGSQVSAPRRPFASSIMVPNAGLSARLAGVVWTLSTRPSSSLRAKALYPGVEGDPFFTHRASGSALNDTSGACGVSSSARDPRSGDRHTTLHQRIAKPAGGRSAREQDRGIAALRPRTRTPQAPPQDRHKRPPVHQTVNPARNSGRPDPRSCFTQKQSHQDTPRKTGQDKTTLSSQKKSCQPIMQRS